MACYSKVVFRNVDVSDRDSGLRSMRNDVLVGQGN